MGINPTPTNHRSFTFDGKSTREFGVYTTGKDVFNSPERAVEMISIPGRDGEYALDRGHFNNIEVTYRAGIVADSTTDFAEAISNFRNWLASREGYCRLTDEYNTEEYRMAVFKNAIALEHEGLLTGEFDVTFDCKPQRYLAIGEELVEIGAWGNTETAEGEVVTIDASSDTAVKALTVDIVPVQSGSGTPSPDNVRPISGHDEVGVSVVGKNLLDVDNVEIGTAWNGNSNSARARLLVPVKPNKEYTISMSGTSTLDGVYYSLWADSSTPVSVSALALPKTFTTGSDKNILCLQFNKTAIAKADVEALKLQLELGSTATTYEPYNGQSYTTQLGQTVYGGTLDIVSGTFKPAPYYASYNGEALEGEWISDRDKYVAGTTPTTGAQVVNIGKVGTATQLTGQSVALLEGENNIFADSGNVTVEYGHNPTILTNPTWFPSKPLLAVDGYGSVKFNNRSIVDIENVPIGDVLLVGASDFWLENRTQTFTLSQDGYNIGDTITVNVTQISFDLLVGVTGLSASAYSATATDSQSGFSTAIERGIGFSTNARFTGITSGSGVEFTAGTSSTFTNVVSGTLTIQKSGSAGNANVTYSVTETIEYDASTNKIKFNLSHTESYTDAKITGVTLVNRFYKAKISSIVVFSTISAVQDTVYIDCDIGECWTIQGDEIVSLNGVISLGSDLPTLPSGDTEVTYDNTITKVEVQPNWWKV